MEVVEKLSVKRGVSLFWLFGINQLKCCLFPGLIFVSLAVTKVVAIPGISRYDLLFVSCVLIQLILLGIKFETLDEFKVIMLFHVIGLALEIYKIQVGSWSYPEPGLIKLGGVPLYSGFMYASIGSYICKAWKVFGLQLTNWPKSVAVWLLCGGIYANFYTHHYIWDLRWWLIGLVFMLFFRTSVSFKVDHFSLKMPMTLSFFLIGFFIWLAENVASYLGAWAYPDQLERWRPVHLGKITSWYLLIIISIMLVAELKQIKRERMVK